VVPNKLLQIAAGELGLDQLKDAELVGDTALITGGADCVAVARAVRDFGKAHEHVTFKLAVVEGSVCSPEEAAQLADLPPKEVLQAQLLGLLQAPAGQLARVLNAKVASIAYVLSAYLSEKEKAA
jgi:large subunit ribosomal protein L10